MTLKEVPMPTEREDDEFGDRRIPMPQGEVIIFWSTGHETVWFYGDSFAALEEYQRALTLPPHAGGPAPQKAID
jgi:hypothetical protein